MSLLPLRVFHCADCGHKMRFFSSHCGNCWMKKPDLQVFLYRSTRFLPLFLAGTAAAVIAVVH